MRMENDTSGSDTDATASDYSGDESDGMNEEHGEITARSTAVRVMDFRRGHRQQHRP